MKCTSLILFTACLFASPASADDIGGITLGMSRADARAVLSQYGRLIESPTITKGPGRGGSSIDAGRYSAILCDDIVVMVSHSRDADFEDFASMAHSKQDAMGPASKANAVSSGGHGRYGALYLTWGMPQATTYTLSYQKDGYAIVMEALVAAPAQLCVPMGKG